MCAITGSFYKEKLKELYTLNAYRGELNYSLATFKPYKGKVEFIISNLADGIRSALSYAGANSLEEYHPSYVIVTNSGINEAKPHLL